MHLQSDIKIDILRPRPHEPINLEARNSPRSRRVLTRRLGACNFSCSDQLYSTDSGQITRFLPVKRRRGARRWKAGKGIAPKTAIGVVSTSVVARHSPNRNTDIARTVSSRPGDFPVVARDSRCGLARMSAMVVMVLHSLAN